MALLHLNSFEIDASDASLQQRYPLASIGGNKTYRDDGFQGKAMTVRDLATQLILTRTSFSTPLALTDTVILNVRFRASGFRPNTLAFEFYQAGVQQIRVIVGTPNSTSKRFQFHFVRGNDTLLYSTGVYDADEWHHFGLKIQFSTNGFIEWRPNGVTEAYVDGINTQINQAGFDEIRIGLQASSFNDYVTIDDLVILDTNIDTAGGPELNDFIGQPIVDVKSVASSFAGIPGLSMVPGGSAVSVADGVDDSIAGVFDGDAAYATTGGLDITTDVFLLTDASYSNQSVFAVLLNFDLRIETPGVTSMVIFWQFGSMFIFGDFFPVSQQTYTRYVSAMNLSIADLEPLTKNNINDFFFGLAKIPVAPPDPVVRASQIFVEILASANPVVEPRPIPFNDAGFAFPAPLALPNWRDPIQLSTQWQTNVRRKKDTAGEERRGLQARPVRTQTSTYTGLESSLFQQVIDDAGYRAVLPMHPMPIWADEMRISEATGQPVGDQLEIAVVDTRWRRISIGQRVVISPRVGARDRDYEATTWWTVERWTQTHLFLKVELLPSGIIPDGGHKVGDRVYPCMDVETSLTSVLRAMSSEIGEAQAIIVTEVQGASTLPGLVDAASSLNLPVGADSYPILVLNENWAGGGSGIEVIRYGEKRPAGKASYLDTDGFRAIFRFERLMTFTTREEWFTFVGLFDVMKAREDVFWLMSPQTSWKFIDINGFVLRVEIPEWYQGLSIERLYSHVGLQTSVDVDRKQFITRKIAAVQIPSPGILRIQLDAFGPAVPQVPFIRVSTGHLVRFDLDSAVESWSSQENVEVRAAFISVEDEEPQIVLNALSPAVEPPDPESIDDLFFWMDANKNAYEKDNLTGAFRRSIGWPHMWFRANRVFDSRKSLQEFIGDLGAASGSVPLPHMLSGTNRIDDPWVSTFARPHLLNGKRMLISAPWFWASHTQGYETVPTTEGVFWDNNEGMTIVICWHDNSDLSPTLTNPAGLELFRISDAAGNQVFEWEPFGHLNPNNGIVEGRIRMYPQRGNQPTSHSFYHVPWMRDTGVTTAVFRWTPGNATLTNYFLQGPVGALSAISSPASIEVPPNFAPQPQLRFFFRGSTLNPRSNLPDIMFEGSETTLPSGIRLATPKRPGLFGLLIYKRALTNAEINTAAGYFRRTYSSPWLDI